MKILTRTAAAVLAAVTAAAVLGGTGSGSCFRSGHQQYQLHCR